MTEDSLAGLLVTILMVTSSTIIIGLIAHLLVLIDSRTQARQTQAFTSSLKRAASAGQPLRAQARGLSSRPQVERRRDGTGSESEA